MTHPTIEAAAQAIFNERAYSDRISDETLALAAARVILSAPPSDAEVAAAIHAYLADYGRGGDLVSGICAALTTALAQRLKQLEGGGDGTP